MKTILLTVILAANVFAQEPRNTPLQSIIAAYLKTKTALAKDMPDSTQTYARELSDALRRMQIESTAGGDRTIWPRYGDAMEHDAAAIGAAVDLKSQRKGFAGLSVNLYTYVKAAHKNTSDLFYQYCPMNDTYWLSETAAIVNPYFGKRMPSCGSIKDTIRHEDGN